MGGFKGGKRGRNDDTPHQGAVGTGVQIEGRIQAKVTRFSYMKGWGFAEPLSGAGEKRVVFIHSDNVDKSDPSLRDVVMRSGDIVECDLEEYDDKIVGRNISIVPQNCSVFDGQFMKGKLSTYDENTGAGTLVCARINGELQFTVDDLPSNFTEKHKQVMFRCTVGKFKKPEAKLICPIWGMQEKEAQSRLTEVLDAMKESELLDDDAYTNLKYSESNDLLQVLPDLDLTTAENPSAVAISAITRERSGKGNGKGKWGKMNMMMMMMKGWGGGKGKGKWGPY